MALPQFALSALELDTADKSAARAIDALAEAQAGLGVDRTRVNHLATSAVEAIEPAIAKLKTKRFTAADVSRLVGQLRSPRFVESISSWDAAAERYLALVPLYQSLEALAPENAAERLGLRQELEELLERLRFKPGYDSPTGFDPKNRAP